MGKNKTFDYFARFIPPDATRFYYLLLWNESVSGEEKQKEILDSIHYAKRIQQALMPSEKNIYRIINKIHAK